MANISITKVNGNVQMMLSDMRGEDIGSIGEFKGNALLEFNKTADESAAEIAVDSYFGGAQVNMKDAESRMVFNGTNLLVEVSDNNNESLITWNAVGSALSALNTGKTVNLNVTQKASDNIFTMGWGAANISDSGSYNISQLGSGDTNFTTTSSSVGALVLGGSGNNIFNINGNYGVFTQKEGAAKYNINSETGDTRTGHMNAILSTGKSNINDNGMYSLIVAKHEASVLSGNGVSSIAILNKDAEVPSDRQYGDCSVIFKDGEDSYKISNYVNLVLSNFLNDRGWTNKKVGASGESYSNFYLGLTGSNHANHITGKSVAELLEEILAKGDEGYKAQH